MSLAAASLAGPGLLLACGLTLLLAPRLVTRERGGWGLDLLLAALLLLSVTAVQGVVALAAAGATALVIAVAARRVSRTATLTLALSAVATGVAAAAIAAGRPRAAFVASIVAFALRTGLFPLQGGVGALTDRGIPLLVRHVATLPVLVFVHLRHTNADAWAVDLAPYLVAVGAASTLLFALIALVQRTLPGLLRASMLMHGGMLFAALGAAGRGHHAAALLVAVTLGLALSGFALMLASFEARVGPLEALGPGGRARAFPRLAAAAAVFGGAAVGLPGTAGFMADDLLLHALWQESVGGAVVTILASALLAVATLAGLARAFLGRPIAQRAPDLLGGERAVVVALLAWLIVLGVVPGVLLDPFAVLLP
ncbi:MAG: proton-conducting transporter transmembrane domain-containing protein [Gemmatirosa sp.]